MKYLTNTIFQYPLQTMGGLQMKNMSLKEKLVIASQVLDLLKPHVVSGHMVEQTVPGLIKYMDSGLAVATITPFFEVLGFAKLYPYFSESDDLPQGYEFSSWISKKKGVGLHILKKIITLFHEHGNPNADLFAVCLSSNPVPQKILFKAGGSLIQRPPYVPNMLEAQTGTPHMETIINLKTIPN